MSKQFTVITQDGSKWLRPVNPHPERLSTHWASIDVSYYNPEWQEFEKNNFDLPYIGNRPDGTTVDESEVTEVRQWRNKNSSVLTWWDIPDGDGAQWGYVNNADYLETRTAYADAQSHSRHITDRMETEEQLAYKSLEEIHQHTALCTNDDEENLFVVGFIHGLRSRPERPFNTQNVRPLVNQLVGEEISFSRFIEILNEIANGKEI